MVLPRSPRRRPRRHIAFALVCSWFFSIEVFLKLVELPGAPGPKFGTRVLRLPSCSGPLAFHELLQLVKRATPSLVVSSRGLRREELVMREVHQGATVFGIAEPHRHHALLPRRPV